MKAIVNARLVYPDRVQDGAILFENGKIVACGDIEIPESAQRIDACGAYLGPGLFDIHCHGFVRAKPRECYSAATESVAMAYAHLRGGTTSITPSAAYSWTEEAFLSCIAGCKAAMKTEKSSIVGIHFEGPYTNPKYGSNSEAAWNYTPEQCERIFDAAGSAVLHCTYAPELPCAPELEDFLKQRGIVADIGHTELAPEDAARAVKKGAKIVTHLFDAMGCWRGEESLLVNGIIQDTADVILLATPGLYYELICDSTGMHVKPENAKLALRTAGEDHIILVTDCINEIDYDPADYPPEHPRSAPDLNYNERGQLSGSLLLLSDACKNFMRFTGADVRTAFKCASTNPAVALGLEEKIGSILPGRDANLLLVDEGFRIQKIFFRGEEILPW